MIIADNTVQSCPGYAPYFDYIADLRNRLRTLTLPFEGGLEMTVRIWRAWRFKHFDRVP